MSTEKENTAIASLMVEADDEVDFKNPADGAMLIIFGMNVVGQSGPPPPISGESRLNSATLVVNLGRPLGDSLGGDSK